MAIAPHTPLPNTGFARRIASSQTHEEVHSSAGGPQQDANRPLEAIVLAGATPPVSDDCRGAL